MAKKKSTKKTAKKAASRAPARAQKTTPKQRGKLTSEDKKTLTLIESTALRVRSSIDKRILPELKFPIRSLSNVKYEKKVGYFELGRGRKARALSVNTVRNFAQTLRLMAQSKEMVANNDFATKRAAY